MISFESRGTFKKTFDFFDKMTGGDVYRALERYAQQGVDALVSATPVDSFLTASAWDYEIKRVRGGATISWINTNLVSGVPVVILLQYGHGTRNGGYVQGRDFINPALKPVFDKIADGVWKVVITS